MNNASHQRLGALALLVAATANCATSTPSRAGDEEPVGTQASAVVLPPRCYGKMLKPTPLELVQPSGQPMTLRVNRTCLQGAPLLDRKIRIYAKGSSGVQQMLMDWTDWAGGTYRFESPWTAGRRLDGEVLPPGRYQIYSYTIHASLLDDWLANDPYARNMSTRSDNTYVEIVDPGSWSSGDWGACSAACGGGTQTRTNTCVDGGSNPIESRLCLAGEPSVSQACNESACVVADNTLAFTLHGVRYSIVLSDRSRGGNRGGGGNAIVFRGSGEGTDSWGAVKVKLPGDATAGTFTAAEAYRPAAQGAYVEIFGESAGGEFFGLIGNLGGPLTYDGTFMTFLHAAGDGDLTDVQLRISL
jgi:hypothetical protein